MSDKPEQRRAVDHRPRITVIGVGGAGCNAVNNMISAGLVGVDFVVANTDAQALSSSSAEHRLQLGSRLTEGLGAGSKPEIGEAAAQEAIDEIRHQIADSHMVFIAAGMGGGTGTGAASVIARASKEMGILTVGVVTKPFQFEGARRMRIAEAGIVELRKHVDTLIVIPNQNLFRVANERTTFEEAFVLADQVLYSGVACIVDLIVKDGIINLDFADVRTIMAGMGTAMLGTGEASGERRAISAAEEAIANPLLDDVSLKGARGLLLSITGGRSLTLYEVDEAADRVKAEVDPDANIIVGATIDETLGEKVRVSIVASGMAKAGQLQAGAPLHGAQALRGGRPGPAFGAPFDPNAASLPRTLQGYQAGVQSQTMMPPVIPQGHPAHQEDIHRRLSEALQQQQPYAEQGQPQEVGFDGQLLGAAEQGLAAPREAWHGPGNVVIEPAEAELTAQQGSPFVPRSAAHSAPPRMTEGMAQSLGENSFVPRATVEIRKPLRRMPEVGDFPPVGQREYRARVFGEADGEAAARESGPERRPGLFGRIAARVRGASDSRDADSHLSKVKSGVPTHLAGDVDARDHVWRKSANSGADAAHGESAERPELPAFFNGRRR